MQLTEELIVTLADQLLGRRPLAYGDVTVDLTPPWRRLAIPELVAERAGVPLDAVVALDLATLKTAAAIQERFRFSTGSATVPTM